MKNQKPIEDSSDSLDRQQLAMELNNKFRFISNQLKKNYYLIVRETHHSTDCFHIYDCSPNTLAIFIPQNKYFICISANYGVRIINGIFDDIINTKTITARKCLPIIDDNYIVYCILRIYEHIYYLTHE